MITERMTEKEIEAEMLADSPNVVNYVEKAIHQKFRRMVLKSSQFPVCIHKEYTSRRKNKWILILRAYSKKDILYSHASYYNTNHGYYAVSLNEKSIIIFPPHFFSRYAERKEIDMHGRDLMIHFFRNNSNFASVTKEIELSDGTKQKVVEGSLEEGVFLGIHKIDDIIIAKTFITREMAKGEQVKNFEIFKVLREEVFKTPSK
ncbi:MAG: hypothetical protein LUG98_05355 [Tannerellaceae bacterium]|nr:hypothetical protein [Tannerellaceae bacterium]